MASILSLSLFQIQIFEIHNGRLCDCHLSNTWLEQLLRTFEVLAIAYWNFVIMMKKGCENWDLPNFERFSLTKKWSWTPTLFKPNYLSSLWSKSKYLSAHQIENFLNFSKLTQLLSVGKFLRPLGAFKQNRTCYLIRCGPVVVVLDQDIIEHSKVWLGQHRFGRFSHSSCQFLWGLKCVFPTEYVKNF